MGWSSQFFTLIVIEGPNAAILLYSPTAGPGNLIGSWAAVGYTDQYGNVIPAGINVNQGILNSVSIIGATITASTIANTIISASQIISPTLTSGTIYETQITFDAGGGNVIGYSTSGNTVVTQTANGTYNFTCPAGVTAAKVECWGAGAGGGGGTNTGFGGGSGGGGEYAQEPAYPLTPGNVYSYTVGNGGNGGSTNGVGSGGSDTSFNGTGGVYANGGDSGTSDGNGGIGGTGSSNTIHFNGGTGGISNGTSGGASGANSGNSTAAGNNGINSPSSAGAAAPAAQTGSGRGGAGGANTSNGSAGGAPGGGGGGAGASTGTGGSFSQTFNCTTSRSYYGSDATNGNPNGTRNSNGTCWQGGETATGGSANGTQKSVFLFNSTAIQAACAGVTVSEVDFTITNAHSWYGSGMSMEIREWLRGQGTSLPASWNGVGSTLLITQTIAEGQRKTFQFFTNTAAPTDFPSGAAIGIAIGPGPAAFDLSYYGYFDGTGSGSNAVQLTIKGTTAGSGFQTAGAGQDGQVKITYSISNSIVFALSPVSGTDASGNDYAAGYTGPVSAFQPGSSPANVETWHTITMDTGWTTQSGYSPCSYRYLSTNDVELKGSASFSFTSSAGKALNSSNPLPAGYQPAFIHDPRSGDPVGSRCHISVGTGGVITCFPPSGATFPNTYFAEIDCSYSLT
jgi:hypothetical protein